jgi:hypothetical protein
MGDEGLTGLLGTVVLLGVANKVLNGPPNRRNCGKCNSDRSMEHPISGAKYCSRCYNPW